MNIVCHFLFIFKCLYIQLYAGTIMAFGWLTMFLSSRAPSSVGIEKCSFFNWWYFWGGIDISSDLGDSLLFCGTLSLSCFPSLTSFPKHLSPVASSPQCDAFPTLPAPIPPLSSPSIQFPRNQSFSYLISELFSLYFTQVLTSFSRVILSLVLPYQGPQTPFLFCICLLPDSLFQHDVVWSWPCWMWQFTLLL